MITAKQSWIGMAGPAMIEGGGLGVYDPKEMALKNNTKMEFSII